MVPEVRIELTTYPLPRGCATTTLLRHPNVRSVPVDRPGKNGCYTVSPRRMKRPKPPPVKKPSTRTDRLAIALRENMKRRKEAARMVRAPAQVPSQGKAAKAALNAAKEGS